MSSEYSVNDHVLSPDCGGLILPFNSTTRIWRHEVEPISITVFPFTHLETNSKAIFRCYRLAACCFLLDKVQTRDLVGTMVVFFLEIFFYVDGRKENDFPMYSF